MVERYQPWAVKKGLILNLSEDQEAIPQLEADELRMSEVLSNLIGNAIKYTQKGSITVRSFLSEDQIYVVTEIRDTGSGIPRKNLPNLFTKYYRVEAEMEEGAKGTGFGLFISKSIIEMHKGKIWVESELGKGSSFFFSLPIETS
jgi:signal transduction histidine kinase